MLVVLLSILAYRNPNKRNKQAAKQLNEFEVWASARSRIAGALQSNVTCAARAGGDGSGITGLCGSPRRAGRCARFVVDDAVPAELVRELRDLIQWLVKEAWGAGAGPPSVVDLHAETISYKENFVNLTQLMEFKQANFTQAQLQAYQDVRQILREQLSQLFGLSTEGLMHDMTFFSQINASKKAKTMHDEYWHSHIDTEQYGTFAYTTLLYLNTQYEDFQGGEFIFEERRYGDTIQPAASVEPRSGRLVVFTSDAENPHKVLPVTQGVRLAMTSAFTCSKTKAAAIAPFPRSLVSSTESTADA